MDSQSLGRRLRVPRSPAFRRSVTLRATLVPTGRPCGQTVAGTQKAQAAAPGLGASQGRSGQAQRGCSEISASATLTPNRALPRTRETRPIRVPSRPASPPRQTCLRHEAPEAVPPGRPSLPAELRSASDFEAAPGPAWAALGRPGSAAPAQRPRLSARRGPRCPAPLGARPGRTRGPPDPWTSKPELPGVTLGRGGGGGLRAPFTSPFATMMTRPGRADARAPPKASR